MCLDDFDCLFLQNALIYHNIYPYNQGNEFGPLWITGDAKSKQQALFQ